MEQRLTFFNTMAQVGGAAFALMFATAQYRWKEWATERLSKISMFSSLFELFALTIISLAVIARISFLWQIVSIASAAVGISISVLHSRAYRNAGTKIHHVDEIQHKFNSIPYFSYGLAAASALLGVFQRYETTSLSLLTVVNLWLLISGCFETYLTLCPNLLKAEPPENAATGS